MKKRIKKYKLLKLQLKNKLENTLMEEWNLWITI